METKKAKVGLGASAIVGITFTLMGVAFLAAGITIYLSLGNRFDGAILFLYIFGGVGALFLLVGLPFVIAFINKKKRCNRLLKEGNYVMAEVSEITRNYNVRVNNRRPYIVKCAYRDGYGNVHIFKSRNILYDPSTILKDNMVKVYVDGENYKHYYMDLDEVLPNVIEH